MTRLVIVPPATFEAGDMTSGVMRSDVNYNEGPTGESDTEVMGPPRWTMMLASEARVPDWLSALWQAMILDLDGAINYLAVHDIYCPVPKGTFNIGLTTKMYATAAAGATTCVIDGTAGNAGKTLLRGDWFGVNQATTNRQALYIMEDAVADGNGRITVRFKNYLRVPAVANSAVVFDKPTWLGRQKPESASSAWKTTNGYGARGGYSVDIVEDWE